MKNNNIRTMEFVGKDDWDRPVYKCAENGILWKDLSTNPEEPDLYSCQNSFYGEPDSPIKASILEIIYKSKYVESPHRFTYMMLDRLKADCEYYLGHGNRYKDYLWSGDEREQIDKMKGLWNALPEGEKPEWLTMEQILEYEKNMLTQ